MGKLPEPVTVANVEWDEDGPPIRASLIGRVDPGTWVSVRPVGDEKTYLGVMLGDYHGTIVAFRPETNTLVVKKDFLGNPAMWVPDLKRVVMGYESWWSAIKSEEDLRQITDADIENVWYVKALKDLNKS